MISACIFCAAALCAQAAPIPPVPSQTSDAGFLAGLRAAQGVYTGPMTLKYTGTYEVEGHNVRPHDISTLAAEVTVSVRQGVVAWSSRLGPAGATGDALGAPERGVLVAGIAYVRQGDKWHAQPALDSVATLHSLGSAIPAMVVASTADAMPNTPGRAKLRTDTGQTVYAQYEPGTMRITDVEWPRAHRRLGDVSDTIHYSDFETRSGVQVPRHINAYVHEDTSSYRVVLNLQPEQPAIDREALDAVTTITPPARSEDSVTAETLGPGLWSFTHSEADTRCLVMEMEDGLMAFEAPLSSSTGERIVEAITRSIPEKKLKAVAFSHYHPHYCGGLRAFVAAGCDVYTTPGLEPFVKEILARPFTRQPDALARAPRTPVIHVVKQIGEVKDAAGEVRLIDIGTQSNHTEEYLLFYFPRHKLLFEGDLAYVVQKGKLFVLSRAKGMIEGIQPLNLQIDKILQAWPAHDAPAQEWSAFTKAAAPATAPSPAPSPAPPPSTTPPTP